MEQFFTPDDVKKIYDIAKSTLANWRNKKTGPPYVKLRNRVLYPAVELREWFESQRIVPLGFRTEMDLSEEIKRKKLLTAVQVSQIYGLNVKTLANWRCQSIGPSYYKLSKMVMYPIDDLEQWLRESLVIPMQREV